MKTSVKYFGLMVGP